MVFVETLELAGLGNRSYLAGGDQAAVAIDPPRDIDQIIALAARRGVRIALVAETHLHNDYLSGGLELARVCGARYLVPEGAAAFFPHATVADGDSVDVDQDVVLHAVATPGHTPHHTSYILNHAEGPLAAFTGGCLLIGAVGRPDLIEPRLTRSLARAQHASVRRLADCLPDEVRVLPTHGFGSFCSSGQVQEDATTIGRERKRNEALTKDAAAFTADLLAGLEDIPAYYAHMTPVNAAGPAPVDLTPPRRADPGELAARLAAGEWLVDLRARRAFAAGHLAGSYNIEAEGSLAVYLAWLIPWGKPVTLLAETREQVADAQRELVRVGVDHPAAVATGRPGDWLQEGREPRAFPCRTFTDLAAARTDGSGPVVVDVRRDSERADGYLAGSVHIPIHQIRARQDEVPPGTAWVHCATGMRAAIAASLLDAAGRDVVTVDDDFDRAARAGLPIVRPD